MEIGKGLDIIILASALNEVDKIVRSINIPHSPISATRLTGPFPCRPSIPSWIWVRGWGGERYVKDRKLSSVQLRSIQGVLAVGCSSDFLLSVL